MGLGALPQWSSSVGAGTDKMSWPTRYDYQYFCRVCTDGGIKRLFDPSFFVVIGHTAMTCKNSSPELAHEKAKATFLRSP